MPPRRKFKVFCENCREELKLNRKLRKYPKRFCSLICSKEYLRGKNSPNYKNGRHIEKNGYIRVLSGDKRRYILEHRYLMEIKLGRKLLSNEYIHHKNGNKHDNRLKNLQVISPNEHTRLHHLGIPDYKNRRFNIVESLGKPRKKNHIISLLPEYRTYITKKCVICKKLFWTRKDHLKITSDPSCSLKCSHAYRKKYDLY